MNVGCGEVSPHQFRERILPIGLIVKQSHSVIELVFNGIALFIEILKLHPVLTGPEAFEINGLPAIENKAIPIHRTANAPISYVILFIRLSNQMQRGVGQVEIEQDWLSPITPLGTAVG